MAVSGLDAYLVREIPRGDVDDSERRGGRAGGDRGRGARVASLVAAYHWGVAGRDGLGGGETGPVRDGCGAVAFGWVRGAAGGPVRVVVAGEALVGSADDKSGDALLSLPAGARGRRLPAGGLAELVGELGCWRVIAGISDGLLTSEGREGGGGGHGDRGQGLSLDDGLLGSWAGAFGWVVIAEPVLPGELAGLADEVGTRQRVAEGSADRVPGRAAQAQRLKERQGEFRRGGSGGFWRIRVLAGGADEASAARVAGLFCASTDLGGLPYALSPAAPGPRGDAAGVPPGGDGVPAVAVLRVDRVAGRAGPAAGGGGARRSSRAAARVRRDPGDRPRRPGRHPAWRGAGPEPDARRAVRRLHRLAQPARVRVRRDRGGQVADRPLPARSGHRARHPVAGGRAGQGRVPADGQPPAWHRGDQDPAGRAGRDRGRASTRSSPPATAPAAGSRCRPTRTWSRPCSPRPSRPRSRSRRCSARR